MEPHKCNDGYYRYLYKIINIETGQYYYGVHKTMKLNDGYMGSGAAIKKDIKLLGKHSFRKDIIKYFETNSDMLNAEADIVDDIILNDPMCYNIVRGGGGYQFKRLFPAYNPITGEIRALSSTDELYTSGKFVHITVGRIAINNGDVVKFIFPSELDKYLQDGWKRGNIPRPKTTSINNGFVVKMIPPSELDKYLQDGWKRGRLPNKCRGKIRINKDSIEKMIFPSELDKYLQDGWKRGSLHKNRVHIHKDSIEKMIFPSELDKYLQDGWKRGTNCHSILGRHKINRDGIQRVCEKSELDKYLQDGWKLGSLATTAGTIAINDGIVMKRITPSKLDKYLQDGWKRGMIKKINKTNH